MRLMDYPQFLDIYHLGVLYRVRTSEHAEFIMDNTLIHVRSIEEDKSEHIIIRVRNADLPVSSAAVLETQIIKIVRATLDHKFGWSACKVPRESPCPIVVWAALRDTDGEASIS